MGTSIGSKVLRYWQAYLLATIFEVTGAVLVGYNITETLRQGIINIPDFEGAPKELLLGQLAILGSTSLFIFIATLFGLPVAGSHSIIGATIGFSTLMRGTKGIHWWKILEIFISWLVSPILSGLTSVILYIVLDFAVLRRKHPLKCGLRTLPIFYFVCFGFITFAVVFHASKGYLSAYKGWCHLCTDICEALFA
uniref:Uncharacterized protein n=1 Tax=Acrobeloides nanus TaxID=290746 RepID=A0A914C190_9BILA